MGVACSCFINHVKILSNSQVYSECRLHWGLNLQPLGECNLELNLTKYFIHYATDLVRITLQMRTVIWIIQTINSHLKNSKTHLKGGLCGCPLRKKGMFFCFFAYIISLSIKIVLLNYNKWIEKTFGLLHLTNVDCFLLLRIVEWRKKICISTFILYCKI